MRDMIYGLASLLIIAVIIILKQGMAIKLDKLISWIIFGSYQRESYRNNSTEVQENVIWRTQHRCVEEKYRILNSEAHYIREILIEFQKDMAKRKGGMRPSWDLLFVSEEDFFIKELSEYLFVNEDKWCFLDYDMFGEKIKEKRDGRDQTYRMLSDFGVAFYKLSYITCVYRRIRNEKHEMEISWHEKNLMEEIVEKRVMTFE